MTDLRDLDRAMGPWLEQQAAPRTPDYLEEMLGRVGRVRQRPSAIAVLSSPDVPSTVDLRRRLVFVGILALLLVALVVAFVVGGGSPARTPLIATFARAATLPWQAMPLSAGPELGDWLDSACISEARPTFEEARARAGGSLGPPRRIVLDIRGEGFVRGLYAAGELAPDATLPDFGSYFYGMCVARVTPDGGGEILAGGFAPCAVCLRLEDWIAAYPVYEHGRPDFADGTEHLLPRPMSSILGRVRPEVVRVVVVLADGRHVDAAVGDGWFSAWWPAVGPAHDASYMPAARVLAYGGSGELLVELAAPTPEPRVP